MPIFALNADFPLSPSLTWRVINYLNGFRLFISLALISAFYADFLTLSGKIESKAFPATLLLTYLLFAAYFAVSTWRKRGEPYRIAQQTLLLDVILISLLLHAFESLGILLVFVGAAAGIMLPLRMALFIASLATISLISEPVIGAGAGRSGDALLRSGLQGLTIFVITTLTHVLASWARDFRLIAERQMVTLTRMEQINELVIRRLRSGVLAVDHDGQVRLMNESAWFLLGSPPVAEKQLADIAPALNEALLEWLRDPGAVPGRVTIQASQAQVVPKFVALPAGREIAQLIFLEDDDVVSRRALELSSISLAELSTGIAHEIRNPLSAISHSAQLLDEDARLEDDQKRLVEIIRKQARRMDGIVGSILQVSRREKSQPEYFPLAEWLRELAEDFNHAHPDHRFALKTHRGDEDAVVMFDRKQLHQIVWQLMENALQHLGDDDKRPELAVRMAVDADTGYAVLSVEDNGKGIPEDKIGRIFEPFFTTRSEGTGLGLYIARQLCEANQAELTVDSTPGWKTRFHIRMMLAGGTDQSLSQEQPIGNEA